MTSAKRNLARVNALTGMTSCTVAGGTGAEESTRRVYGPVRVQGRG